MEVEAVKELMSTLLLTVILTVSCCSISSSARSGETIVATYGSTPAVDGLINGDEWEDAKNATVLVTDGANCTIYVKQDSVNLYIAVNVPDSTFNRSDSFAVLFDVDHDENQSLQADDIWLAVSRQGNMYERNVTWQVTEYGWLPTSVFGWTAKTDSTSSHWQAECNITYSKIDVEAGTNKSLGLMFIVIDIDVESGWYKWPSEANIRDPSTWGDLNSNGYNWIPEFPTLTSTLLLFMMLTIAVTLYKQRNRRN